MRIGGDVCRRGVVYCVCWMLVYGVVSGVLSVNRLSMCVMV